MRGDGETLWQASAPSPARCVPPPRSPLDAPPHLTRRSISRPFESVQNSAPLSKSELYWMTTSLPIPSSMGMGPTVHSSSTYGWSR